MRRATRSRLLIPALALPLLVGFLDDECPPSLNTSDSQARPNINEGKNGCGPGAIAREVTAYLERTGLKRPEAFGPDAKSLYEWAKNQGNWDEDNGMKPEGIKATLEKARAAIRAAQPKKKHDKKKKKTKKKPAPTVDIYYGHDRTKKKLTDGVDLSAGYLAAKDALKDPNKAVIFHTGTFQGNGFSHIAHFYAGTGISGSLVEDEFDVETGCEARGVTLSGVDDGINNLGSGDDPQVQSDFNDGGIQILEGEQGPDPDEPPNIDPLADREVVAAIIIVSF